MFKIVAPTKTLLKFLLMFKLNLSQPQMRHLINFMDALLACDGTITIARLNNLIYHSTDQSAFTDFFTYSPWNDSQLRQNTRLSLVKWVLEENLNSFFSEPVYITIDDSKSLKPKTSKSFDITDWFFNTTDSHGYYYGSSFVTFHFSCGKRSIPFTVYPYLREKTVRRINRHRSKNKKIPFKSKYTIAKEILNELSGYIPKGLPVYILFDSWYASAKLIKFCRRRSWHVICALKNNRKFRAKNKQIARQLSNIARYTRNREFTSILVKSSNASTRYWVNTKRGFLNDIKDEVSIIISKRHPKDRSPEFFMTTDLSLSAYYALSRYTRRWVIEVDHLYLKVRLGLADFRLRSYEGIRRYFDLICLTLAYLYWRQIEEPNTDSKRLSDVIADHRKEQQRTFLREFGEQVLKYNSVDLALNEFYKEAA
jgi:hypothetical protein